MIRARFSPSLLRGDGRGKRGQVRQSEANETTAAGDPAALRAAFGNFVTGVTVVTALDGSRRPRGFTANSFTSVSLDPPLLLVCIAHSASVCAVFAAAEGFSVNVLSEEQRALGEGFARRAVDRFAGVDWVPGHTGAPRLTRSLVHLDCSVHRRVDAGDHMILIGRVRGHAVRAGRPLVFARGSFVRGGFVPLAGQPGALAETVEGEVP